MVVIRNSNNNSMMPLKEFHRRLARILGTTTTDSIVKVLETNGVITNNEVDLTRLQGSFESLFQDAGVLLMNEIVKEPFETHPSGKTQNSE